ncbi:DUF302 domain-containing protein [Prosthecobacter sp.]|uniref:DUF302 domain-containing protein n=1 Tax=Prosthecobacter sp. TaxID=1965333 RepID=UPI001D23E8EE|nr:DUF302 domain-containing protein [Prosthecobacter sp.]MCB1277217.1 DUF302 domain-containing protein [Prosthecobacter sp.]
MNPRYVVETTKSPDQAVADLEASVKQHGYGVLHVYDLKATLASKGFDLPNACHILEVCNPKQAVAVLTADMGMNIALPCRISVYQDGGKTLIGMARPSALLASLSQAEELKAIAEQVEKDTIAIIEAAK